MEITASHREQLIQISDRYGLALVICFGSAATGKTHPESDVDIAVWGNCRLELEAILALGRDLELLFPRVDVCDLRVAPPLLKAAVVQDGQVLFERERSFYEFLKLRFIAEYLDFKPWLEKLRQQNAQAIAELE